MRCYLAVPANGAGRHPCMGMKVAKLEVKMNLALMLTRYKYSLVGASGALTAVIPKLGRNDIQRVLMLFNDK